MKTAFNNFCKEINFKKTPSFDNFKITKAQLFNKNLFEINFNAKKIIPFVEMEQFLDQIWNNFQYKIKFNLKVDIPSYSSSEITNYLNWIISRYLKNKNLADVVLKSIVKVESTGAVNLSFSDAIFETQFLKLEKKISKIMHKFGFKDIIFISDFNDDDILEKARKSELEDLSNYIAQEKIKLNNSPLMMTKNIQLTIKELYKEPLHNKISVAGKVFDIKERKLKNGKVMFIFSITDYTEAIYVRTFAATPASFEYYKTIEINNNLLVEGVLEINSYSNQNIRMINVNKGSIKKIKEIATADNRYDDEKNKRVELSFHTKMSTMDGISTPQEIINRVKKWGHKAAAIIDLDSVQSFPNFYKVAKENNIKSIYGVSIGAIDKSSNVIFNKQKHNLLNDEYVVFDLETTGLSPEFNEIIEFGAVIIKNNKIIDEIEFLMKPSHSIPLEVIELTKITNEMVKDAISEKAGINKILNFIGNRTLVAHNAIFDYTFLLSKVKKYNLGKIKNPIIDTLVTSRMLFPDAKRFRLEKVAKMYNVDYDLSDAHRSKYDAQVLASIFIKQLKDFYVLGVITQNDLDFYKAKKIDEKKFSHSVTIIAKNQKGLKDLFNIVSKSLTKNFHRNGRVHIEDLSQKDNLLIGSGGLTSRLVNLIFTGSYDQIIKEISKYDYIEVQPPQNFIHRINQDFSWNNLYKMLKFIIYEAKRQNKIIVATGDVRYIDKNEKICYEIYINTKGLGGVHHYLYDNCKKTKKYPDQHFLTTKEMMQQFNFIKDKNLIKEIVITNSNKIADSVDNIEIIRKKLYPPKMDDVDIKLENLVYKKAKEKYGNNLPDYIATRIKREIEPIKKYGFTVIYWISYLLVDKSLQDGYLVGSRGSVGSSFVARMTNITEVNPLVPHYLCSKCKFSQFFKDSPLNSGYDLPDKNCPKCNQPLSKDGQKIPFETFLGFEADKVPDIDLNFSGDYQKIVHDEVKNIFGKNHTFRAGTISTVAEKMAFGYVKGWIEEFNKFISKPFIEFLAKKIAGTKRTTGQHPGGIIIIPQNMSVEDFTPINYPANDKNSNWKTTHFDFSAIHDNVVKLDLLGHDDPTAIKYLEKITGVNAKKDISFYDKKVISLFSSTKELGIMPSDINGETTGVMGIPEFGTTFVRKMLKSAKVSSFGDLISISGLSHGTNVWTNNAELVIKEQGKNLSELISCRDDIMTDLIAKGIDASLSFQVMEQVRKGKGITAYQEKVLKEHNVKNWYIESLKKIKYMFPKAHATAYVMMAWRIAWFKVYYPSAYYAAYFTTRADVFDVEAVIKGKEATLKKLQLLKSRKNLKNSDMLSNKEIALIPVLELVNEAFSRKIKIGNISLQKSQAKNWIIDKDGVLIPPFIAVDGLGITVANSIIDARKEQEFISIEDFSSRTLVNKKILDNLKVLCVLDSLSEQNQISMFDFNI